MFYINSTQFRASRCLGSEMQLSGEIQLSSAIRHSSTIFLWGGIIFASLYFVVPVWGAESIPQTSPPLAPLTLADAERRALKRSRQLNAQDAEILASHQMATAALELPDPVLKLGVDNLPIDGADRYSLTRDFMTMRRIGVMQEMTRTDKRHFKSERFEREAEKSLAEKNATIAAIERSTALAWFDRYYAQRALTLFAEQAQLVQLELSAAKSAYRSGRGSQADVFAAQSVITMMEDRASEMALKLRAAKMRLTRWVGGDSEVPLAGLPDVDVIPLQVDDLEQQLKDQPEIAVQAKRIEIAQAEAELAKANKSTDWSWEFTYQKRGSSLSNMASFSVSLSLQWDQKNRQNKDLSAKLAMIEEAHAKSDEMLRALVYETHITIAEWEKNRQRRTRYQNELLVFAKDRTQSVMGAYRGGKAALAEVLAARRNEMETHLQLLQIEWEIAKLWVQLHYIFPVFHIADFHIFNSSEVHP